MSLINDHECNSTVLANASKFYKYSNKPEPTILSNLLFVAEIELALHGLFNLLASFKLGKKMFKSKLIALTIVMVITACSEQDKKESFVQKDLGTKTQIPELVVDKEKLSTAERQYFTRINDIRAKLALDPKLDNKLILSRKTAEAAILYFEGLNGFPKSTQKAVLILNEGLSLENEFIDTKLAIESTKLGNTNAHVKKKKLDQLNSELLQDMDSMAAGAYMGAMDSELITKYTHLSLLVEIMSKFQLPECRFQQAKPNISIDKCINESFIRNRHKKYANLYLLSRLKNSKVEIPNSKYINYALAALPNLKIPDLHKAMFADWFISKGANVNYRSSERDPTVLYNAVQKLTDNEGKYDSDTFELVKKLLNNKADPNLGPKNYKMELQSNPAFELIKKASFDTRMVKLIELFNAMISNGLDISIKNEAGFSLLGLSAYSGKPDTTKFLLTNGASAIKPETVYINRNVKTLTPIELAVAGEQLEQEKVFIEFGYDTSSKFDSLRDTRYKAEQAEAIRLEKLQKLANKTPYYAFAKCISNDGYETLKLRECLTEDGYIQVTSSGKSEAILYDDLGWENSKKIMLSKKYRIEAIKGTLYTSDYKLLIEIYDVVTGERVAGKWTAYIKDKLIFES